MREMEYDEREARGRGRERNEGKSYGVHMKEVVGTTMPRLAVSIHRDQVMVIMGDVTEVTYDLSSLSLPIFPVA